MRKEHFIRRLRKADADLRKRQKHSERGPWFGLGLFGLVGWSVALPTVAGAGIGIFIDSRFDTGYSWTLILLAGGVILGCVNAWFWVSREREKIHEENDNE